MFTYPKVVAERQSAGRIDAWTEYLRLSQCGVGKAMLDICQYEVLAEVDALDIAETDCRFSLPERIDGKPVLGIEGDYVVGGDLHRSTDWELVFSASEIDKVIEFLRVQFNLDEGAISELRGAVSEAVSSCEPDDGAEELAAWRKRRERQRDG